MGRIIALLTDFGVTDSYVGVMKAVMRQICSDTDFIDLTHAIMPQNVREAALTLLGAYRYFPPRTIFLVVVDPGVGNTRRPVAVQVGGYSFVAPDNGVLSYVLAELGQYQAVELHKKEFHLQPTSQTFHGRDIFAPAAAHLANDVLLRELGSQIHELVTLALPVLAIAPTRITGEVVHIDHFGNIITSIGDLRWHDSTTLRLQPRFVAGDSQHKLSANRLTVVLNGHQVQGVRQSNSFVGVGELLALVGSSGCLELAVNQGNGAEQLKAEVGDCVEIWVQ